MIPASSAPIQQSIPNFSVRENSQEAFGSVQFHVGGDASLDRPMHDGAGSYWSEGNGSKLKILTASQKSGRSNIELAREVSKAVKEMPPEHRRAYGADTEKRKATCTSTDLENLTYLPESLSEDITRFAAHKSGTNQNTKSVVNRVWNVLQDNTERSQKEWDFVIPSFTQPRFTDIGLVRRTALTDIVRTKTDGPYCHYLHANMVGLGTNHQFIASQKPYKHEIAGFLNMIREKKVGVVLDLTKADENPDNAMDPSYYPIAENEQRKVGANGHQIAVICNRVKDCARQQHAARKKDVGLSSGKQRVKRPSKPALPTEQLTQQDLTIGEGASRHKVKRLHFSGWPDKGMISCDELVGLADRVEAASIQVGGPILVHCKAGVGRTGTIMSFIAARERIATAMKDGKDCDPGVIVRTAMEVVAQGRLDRGPCFVQTQEQFGLVVDALLHTFADGQIPLYTFADRQVPLSVPASPKAVAWAKQVFTFNRQPVEAPSKNVAVNRQNSVRSKLSSGVVTSPSPVLSAPARQASQPLKSIRLPVQPNAVSNSDFIDSREVGANTRGVSCPRKTAIQVAMENMGSSVMTYLHANAIRFIRKASNQLPEAGANGNPKFVVAGQSPQHFRQCEKFLLQGLDSGQGLFQFVSRAAHHAPQNAADKTILGQLRDEMQQSKESRRDLILGGRYKVSSLQEITDASDGSHDHARFRLTVTDVRDPTITRTAIVTQAGLKFVNNVLDVQEIERAHALATSHVKINDHIARDQDGPMIVSYSGIGRNAALIAYREALSRFDEVENPETLDKLVDDIVAQGRRDRGPCFVHSEQQVQKLKEAARKAFVMRRGASVQVKP